MKYLLRLSDVQKHIPESRSGLYGKISEGLLTPPVKWGERLSAWPSDEIEALMNARIAGKTDDEIRQLVKQLVAARKNAA